MIACSAAVPRATLALVIRQSAATKRRRTDDGHHSQERTPMSQLPNQSEALDQIRRQARLATIAQARTGQVLATMRQLIADLADNAQAEGAAAHTIETLVREVSSSLPCQHPASRLRYIGRHQWTGGPELVHAAECSRALGGCGQLIVLEQGGGARAVDSGSRFMSSTISG